MARQSIRRELNQKKIDLQKKIGLNRVEQKIEKREDVSVELSEKVSMDSVPEEHEDVELKPEAIEEKSEDLEAPLMVEVVSVEEVVEEVIEEDVSTIEDKESLKPKKKGPKKGRPKSSKPKE